MLVRLSLGNLKMSTSRGALIVLEGCDRSGKSTQCGKLVDALRKAGMKCRLLHFPGEFLSVGIYGHTLVNESFWACQVM